MVDNNNNNREKATIEIGLNNTSSSSSGPICICGLIQKNCVVCSHQNYEANEKDSKKSQPNRDLYSDFAPQIPTGMKKAWSFQNNFSETELLPSSSLLSSASSLLYIDSIEKERRKIKEGQQKQQQKHQQYQQQQHIHEEKKGTRFNKILLPLLSLRQNTSSSSSNNRLSLPGTAEASSAATAATTITTTEIAAAVPPADVDNTRFFVDDSCRLCTWSYANCQCLKIGKACQSSLGTSNCITTTITTPANTTTTTTTTNINSSSSDNNRLLGTNMTCAGYAQNFKQYNGDDQDGNSGCQCNGTCYYSKNNQWILVSKL